MPFPLIPLLISAGGALMQGIGNATNKPKDETARWLEQFNAQGGFAQGNRDLNAGRSQPWFNALSQGSGPLSVPSWYSAAQGLQGQQQDFLNQINQSANRSGSNIWNSFMNTQPQMERWASGIADQSTQRTGSSMRDQAQLASSEGLRALEARLGSSGVFGSSGGGALAALAQGAQAPLLQAETALAQMQSQAFQNAFNPMAQAGYGRELNRTNELLNALTGANQTMGVLGGIGQGLAGFLNDQAQQQLLAPSFASQPNMLQTIGGALTGSGFQGLGNFDWSKLFGGGASNMNPYASAGGSFGAFAGQQ